jgi:hypothetical protein
MKLLLIFLTGFAQVALASANIYFISRTSWGGIALCGWGVSYLWTFNVKKINIGSHLEQLTYATGAMSGGLTGVVLAKILK